MTRLTCLQTPICSTGARSYGARLWLPIDCIQIPPSVGVVRDKLVTLSTAESEQRQPRCCRTMARKKVDVRPCRTAQQEGTDCAGAVAESVHLLHKCFSGRVEGHSDLWALASVNGFYKHGGSVCFSQRFFLKPCMHH